MKQIALTLFAIAALSRASSGQVAAGGPAGRAPAAGFHVEAAAGEPSGAKAARVREVLLPGVLETTGQVAFDDRRIATISSRVRGRIEEVDTSLWETVAEGQPILKLYSPDFLTAEAEYLQAKGMTGSRAIVQAGAWMAQAAKRKLELLGMEDSDIEALKRPSTVIALKAPIGGVILQNDSLRGASVNPGDALFQVGRLDRVWITADVYEVDLGRVQVGQELAAVTAAYPDEVFRGKISRVSPEIDPESHTAQIRCEVENPGGRLRPRMLARVRVLTKPAAALVVPQKSLVFDGDSYYAFVETGANSVERRKVEISSWNERGYARVVSGLKTGELVLPESLRLNALWHRSRGESD